MKIQMSILKVILISIFPNLRTIFCCDLDSVILILRSMNHKKSSEIEFEKVHGDASYGNSTHTSVKIFAPNQTSL